jgi:hypothetical protein
MHECFLRLPFFSQGCPDFTADDASLSHPHDTPVSPAVPSQTAGAGSLASGRSRSPLGHRERLLRHRRYCSQIHVCRPLFPPQPRPFRAPPIPPLSIPFALLADGALRPPYLFKKTSAHNRGDLPPTSPFLGLRIKPIRKSSPPPGTAPPGRFTCSKSLVYTTAGSLPPTTAFPGLRIKPVTRLLATVERLLQDRHD